METKKKQLLDAMKALPMTMEDKCAFVDLISQSSGNGGNQEDEWLYFDVRDINFQTMKTAILVFPYVIVNLHGDVLKINSAQALNLSQEGVNVELIAIQAKGTIFNISGHTNSPILYAKTNTFDLTNYIGAKQITKEEYNSFINFTEDDFEETPLE